MIISYYVGTSMYLNLTNKCTNDCVFCIRNFDHSLRLERDPTPEEIWKDVAKRKGAFQEIVFCGFGEPMFRLDDVIIPLAGKLKDAFSIPIRVNTNGHAGFLYPGRGVAEELATRDVDRVSISLVAESAWLYNFLCKPKFIKDIDDDVAHRHVLSFISECRKQAGLEVEVTALAFPPQVMPQGIPSPNISKCAEIVDGLNVKFRARRYYGPNLYASILCKYSG